MKQYYNKLVRDKIPEIIEAAGKKANYRYCENGSFFRNLLAAKIVEEATELAEAIKSNDRAAALEELIDLKTVVCEIEKIYQMYEAEVLNKFAEKLDKKGGFYERIFLESVEDVEDEEFRDC